MVSTAYRAAYRAPVYVYAMLRTGIAVTGILLFVGCSSSDDSSKVDANYIETVIKNNGPDQLRQLCSMLSGNTAQLSKAAGVDLTYADVTADSSEGVYSVICQYDSNEGTVAAFAIVYPDAASAEAAANGNSDRTREGRVLVDIGQNFADQAFDEAAKKVLLSNLAG